MTHLGLFEGIGGFSLAASWMRWKTKAWCEWNPFCQKVLKHHFPEAEGHGDITTTDFTKYANTIDVLTGGDPCQPSSRANAKRKGKEDERYLWPEYRRVIKEVYPKWIVNENVTGTIENGILDEKISDLETLGYSWWTPLIIPASSVGANHRRERVWLVAYADTERMERRSEEQILGKQYIQGRQISEPFQEGEELFNTFESRLCRTLHGLPSGVDRIKSLGNSIVPQVAYEIFKAIEQTQADMAEW